VLSPTNNNKKKPRKENKSPPPKKKKKLKIYNYPDLIVLAAMAIWGGCLVKVIIF
jgi:hypothetical protein